MRSIKKISNHDNKYYSNLVHEGRVQEHADLWQEVLVCDETYLPCQKFYMHVHTLTSLFKAEGRTSQRRLLRLYRRLK